MQKPPSIWLRLLPVALFFLLCTGAAAAALTVVHLRQEEGQLAKSEFKLQGDLSESSRRLREMTATVAEAQEPDVLKTAVGNRLAPVLDKQVVWVRPVSSPIQPEAPVAVTPILSTRIASIEPVALPKLHQ